MHQWIWFRSFVGEGDFFCCRCAILPSRTEASAPQNATLACYVMFRNSAWAGHLECDFISLQKPFSMSSLLTVLGDRHFLSLIRASSESRTLATCPYTIRHWHRYLSTSHRAGLGPALYIDSNRNCRILKEGSTTHPGANWWVVLPLSSLYARGLFAETTYIYLISNHRIDKARPFRLFPETRLLPTRLTVHNTIKTYMYANKCNTNTYTQIVNLLFQPAV